MSLTKSIWQNQKLLQAIRSLLLSTFGFVVFFLFFTIFSFYEEKGISSLNELLIMIIPCSIISTLVLTTFLFTFKKKFDKQSSET
jgi:glucose uptake protein GlcU